jgi:hypothetical protein
MANNGDEKDRKLTRRQYLVLATALEKPQSNILSILEAVDSTALAHPEWDMEEEKTWTGWNEKPDT